jgi:hypothetical protein
MRRKRSKALLPVMLAELAFASAETIARRTWMMATGSCSPAEYQRMLMEKVKAAQQSGMAALSSKRVKNTALLAPWHRAARHNAKRLRRPK